MTPQQASLLTPPEQRAHARRTDPLSSHEAAARASNRLTDTQDRILVALRMGGPGTDEQIESRFRKWWPEFRVSPQSIRSRRSELVKRGLVRPADRRGTTQFGNSSQVWEVVL